MGDVADAVKPVRLTIKTANIGRDVPAARTRANIERLKRTPMRGRRQQAVLWQELDDDDKPWERGMVHDLYPAVRWDTVPAARQPGCHVPVTLPKPWRIVEHHATKVSSGKAKISPDRYVNLTIATHPQLADPVGFVSFQLVAGAWTNPGQAEEAYRADAWAEGFAGAKAVVNDAALTGLTVIGGNDANNPHMPAIHPRAHVIVHQSLDYLWYVEGSTTVRVRGKGITNLTIDGHESPWARLDLSNKEK